MELAAKSILRLHAFTGCDTTSAFCGKEKLKPLNILLKNSHYINTFANIGVDASLVDDTSNVLQQFVIFISIKGKTPIFRDIGFILANKEDWKQKIFLHVSAASSYMLHVRLINHLCGEIV